MAQYQGHIDVYDDKLLFFQKLRTSHQENIERIQGMNQKGSQVKKLEKHRSKLEKETTTDALEANKLHSEAILDEINKELLFQEECYKQYVELSKKYNPSLLNPVDESYKIDLHNLVDKVDDQPENKI